MIAPLASRLRFLASECSKESQLVWPSNPARAQLVGLAIQLGYQARVVDSKQDYDLAVAWLVEAADRLAEHILAREAKLHG